MDDGQTAAASDALPPRSVDGLRTRPRVAASPGALVALGLFSAGGILLELALTRLLSTLYYPPYVFGVLSLAVLGIGLGAAGVAWRPAWGRLRHVPRYMALAGLSALGVVALSVWTAGLSLGFVLVGLVALPYIWMGLALASLFAAASEASPRLYLADLAGAGLGALLLVPTLNALGALNGALLAAGVLTAAAWWMAGGLPGGHGARLATAGLATALLLVGSNLAMGWLRPDMAALASAKPIVEGLAGGGRIVATVWDAFARTDLVAPGDGGPYRLYLDGAAPSVMPPAKDNDYLWSDIGLFPFATEQPERVFIIGPGGGLDIWFGLQSQAREMVAVEVNPASVTLVNRFAAYNGDLYRQPSVRVLVDEGRSVLRREATHYDLIFLSQVVTLAAERTGYALVENSTYTLEAFTDYLAHLAPDGQLAIKLYDELTLSRALITAVAALEQEGLTERQALAHVAVFLDPDGEPPIPLLLVRRSPFTRQQLSVLAAVARQVGFVPLYLPQLYAEAPLRQVEAGAVTFDQLVAAAEGDISPTTDDRPFFYQFERGVPRGLRPLLWILGFVLAVGAVGVGVVQRRVRPRAARWLPAYFAAVGLGFMALEVALIQQTRLFLGHPTLAVTAVLGVLLVGGGLGSGLAGRWWRGDSLPVLPALGVAVAGLAWLLGWPWLSRTFFQADLGVRLGVVVMALLPLALLMGMPFPLGLRVAGRLGRSQVALAWAVNGVLTVVASVGGVALALRAGFTGVLWAALVAYLLAAATAWYTARATRGTSCPTAKQGGA
ncbi:MAG: hypothetical protein KatS3mg050_5013 [Litorilinea sp.]|nr:MAG: hypothetical protein KatS3mg050_5013 [Litorilinea sp.]